MSVAEERAQHLGSIAQQLAGRIRDEDPEDVGRWLRAELPNPADWFELCFALAAAMPVDVSFSLLTAWTNEGGDPVINQRRAILLARSPKPKRFSLTEHKDTILDMRRRGIGYARIANSLGCDKSTIAKFCQIHETEAEAA